MPIIVILVDWGIEFLIFIILVSSMLSWFRLDPRHPLVRFTRAIVGPVLHPISLVLPSTGKMDFSPMIAVVILWGLQQLLRSGSL
jgi:YggT family protein